MEPSSVDLAVFHNLESKKCNITTSNDKGEHISNCDHLQRIAVGLKYYNLMQNGKIENDHFLQFCQEIYTILLDDYFHFVQTHSDHLDQLKQELQHKHLIPDCNVKKCESIGRHYRSSLRMYKTDDIHDSVYTHYIECFDRLHHQIFHLYSLGLRVETKFNIAGDTNDDQDSNTNLMIDNAFENMKQNIFKKRDEFQASQFERLQNQTKNKFNLSIDNKSSNNKSGITFLDAALKHLDIDPQNDINSLENLIDKEEYDSDSCMLDLRDLNTSNLYKNLDDKQRIINFKTYVTNYQCMCIYHEFKVESIHFTQCLIAIISV